MRFEQSYNLILFFQTHLLNLGEMRTHPTVIEASKHRPNPLTHRRQFSHSLPYTILEDVMQLLKKVDGVRVHINDLLAPPQRPDLVRTPRLLLGMEGTIKLTEMGK